ncbi:hypothetical protein RHMOL_Rhmol04G0158400 [Rhododendron molle]|nr:hypothetical protein RHMOL_Rhmol04G0158400 [Rhododendron molle]
MVCANCRGGFVQELDDVLSVNQLSLDSSHEEEVENHDQRPGFMDAFVNFMRDRIVGINHNGGTRGRLDSHPEHTTFAPSCFSVARCPQTVGLKSFLIKLAE